MSGLLLPAWSVGALVYRGTGSATLSGVTWTVLGTVTTVTGALVTELTVSLGAYGGGPSGTLSSDVGPIHCRSFA